MEFAQNVAVTSTFDDENCYGYRNRNRVERLARMFGGIKELLVVDFYGKTYHAGDHGSVTAEEASLELDMADICYCPNPFYWHEPTLKYWNWKDLDSPDCGTLREGKTFFSDAACDFRNELAAARSSAVFRGQRDWSVPNITLVRLLGPKEDEEIVRLRKVYWEGVQVE